MTLIRLWIALSLLGTLFLSPHQAAAADICHLVVRAGDLTSQQTDWLSQRFYKVKQVPNLDFKGLDVVVHMPSSREYGLSAEPSGAVKFYYRHSAADQTQRLMFLPLKNLNELSDCTGARAWVKNYNRIRNDVAKVIRWLKTSENLGESLLLTEGLVFGLRRMKPPGTDVIAAYRQMLTDAQKTHAELDPKGEALSGTMSKEAFLKLLSALRKLTFNRGLVNYCRDQASMTHVLTEFCANCSAQTKIILSLYNDLKLKPPQGWSFGAELFTDHVRPVLWNPAENAVIDLVYNKIAKVNGNPILSPAGLLRRTLFNVGGLVWPEDALSQSPQDIYQAGPSKGFMGFLGDLFKKAPPATATLEFARFLSKDGDREATAYENIAINRFSESDPPEYADLSFALEAEYMPEEKAEPFAPENKSSRRQGGLSGTSGKAPQNASDIFEEQLNYVTPSDQAVYRRILAKQSPPEELIRYGRRQFLEQLECGSAEDLNSVLIPLRIELASDFGIKSEDIGRRIYVPFGEGNRGMPTVYLSDRIEVESLRVLSVPERYAYFYNQDISGIRRYVNVSLPEFERFYSADNPFEYWQTNREALDQAIVNSKTYSRGVYNRFPWACDNASVKSYAAVAPVFKPNLMRFHKSLVAFAESIDKASRQKILQLDKLPAKDNLDFFIFNSKLEDGYFPGLDDAQNAIHAASALGYQNIHRPFANLLSKMLKDPDYFYTTKMTKIEEQIMAPLLPSGHELRLPKIQLPPPVKSQHCEPGQVFVPSGFLFQECPMKKKLSEGQVISRQVEVINPYILPQLMKAGFEKLMAPTLAALVYGSWREANDKAALEVFPELANPGLEKKIITATDPFGRKIEREFWISMAPLENDYLFETDAEKLAARISRELDSSANKFRAFWRYMDALMWPGMPVLTAEEMASQEDQTPLVVEAHRRSRSRSTPAWTEADPIFAEAFAFYDQVSRAKGRKPIVFVETETGPYVEEWGDSFLARIPGASETWDLGIYQWRSETSLGFEGPFFATSANVAAADGDLIFLLNMMDVGDRIYVALHGSVYGLGFDSE